METEWHEAFTVRLRRSHNRVLRSTELSLVVIMNFLPLYGVSPGYRPCVGSSPIFFAGPRRRPAEEAPLIEKPVAGHARYCGVLLSPPLSPSHSLSLLKLNDKTMKEKKKASGVKRKLRSCRHDPVKLYAAAPRCLQWRVGACCGS